MHSIERTGTF